MKSLHDQFRNCGGEIEGGDRNYLLQNYAPDRPAGQYFAGRWPRFTGSSSRLATTIYLRQSEVITSGRTAAAARGAPPRRLPQSTAPRSSRRTAPRKNDCPSIRLSKRSSQPRL